MPLERVEIPTPGTTKLKSSNELRNLCFFVIFSWSVITVMAARWAFGLDFLTLEGSHAPFDRIVSGTVAIGSLCIVLFFVWVFWKQEGFRAVYYLNKSGVRKVQPSGKDAFASWDDLVAVAPGYRKFRFRDSRSLAIVGVPRREYSQEVFFRLASEWGRTELLLPSIVEKSDLEKNISTLWREFVARRIRH